MSEKEPLYTWLFIRRDAQLNYVRGTYIEFAKKIDDKVIEKELVFVPGLDIHPKDINAAFDFPFGSRQGGVILKFKSQSGNTWWIELNKEAFYRELYKAKNLEKDGYFKTAAIIYKSLGISRVIKTREAKRWSKYWMY